MISKDNAVYIYTLERCGKEEKRRFRTPAAGKILAADCSGRLEVSARQGICETKLLVFFLFFEYRDKSMLDRMKLNSIQIRRLFHG